MAAPIPRTISRADLSDLRQEFAQMLDKLQSSAKPESPLFRSGIELIKLTVNVGGRMEFSIVIAGKDAPKVADAGSAE